MRQGTIHPNTEIQLEVATSTFIHRCRNVKESGFTMTPSVLTLDTTYKQRVQKSIQSI